MVLDGATQIAQAAIGSTPDIAAPAIERVGRLEPGVAPQLDGRRSAFACHGLDHPGEKVGDPAPAPVRRYVQTFQFDSPGFEWLPAGDRYNRPASVQHDPELAARLRVRAGRSEKVGTFAVGIHDTTRVLGPARRYEGDHTPPVAVERAPQLQSLRKCSQKSVPAAAVASPDIVSTIGAARAG